MANKQSLSAESLSSTITILREQSEFRALIAQYASNTDSIIICDSALQAHINYSTFPNIIFLSIDESRKNWQTVEQVLQFATERQISRAGTFLIIGGGVTTDLASFAASIYCRGIKHVLVPSTLLAMVDAAFGGKSGINFLGYKNMLGTFSPAQSIYIFPPLLSTLSQKEITSGIAEAIKSALLGDTALFALLRAKQAAIIEQRDLTVISEVIQRSLAVKASFVEKDFNDSGVRAYLNLGHTFAHALESISNFALWSHGEAVAWGIAQAMRLGLILKKTDQRYADTVLHLLHAFGYQTEIEDLDWNALLAALLHDKKTVKTTIKFIIQNNFGKTEIVALDVESVSTIIMRDFARQ